MAREGADPVAVDPDEVDVEQQLLIAASRDRPEDDAPQAEEALNGSGVNGSAANGNGHGALVTFQPEAKASPDGKASPKSALKGGVTYTPVPLAEVRTPVWCSK